MNDLIQKLLESIEEPTFIKNEKGVYIACNNAFENYLGIDKNKIIGKNAFGVAPTSLAKIYVEADKQLFARGSMQIYKAAVVDAHQQMTAVVFTKTIFLNDNDEVAGFIGNINALGPINLQQRNPKVDLTKREFEVLCLMVKGMPSKKIAQVLGISNHTVGDYLKSIHSKLGAHNRVSVIIAAQKFGLI